MTGAPATTTLTAFLTARLDEDEAAARAASNPAEGKWWVDGPALVSRKHWIYATGEKFTSPDIAAHIARHDPARVLAQVAAMRAVVAEHRLITDPARLVKVWRDPTPGMACERCAGDPLGDRPLEDIGPCDTLRHLAAIYSDHPDYREEWRP